MAENKIIKPIKVVDYNLKHQNQNDVLLNVFEKIQNNIKNNDNIILLAKDIIVTIDMQEVAKTLKASRDSMNKIRQYKSRIVDEKGILGEVLFEKFLFDSRIKNIDMLDIDKYFNNNILNYSNIETDWVNQACLNNSKDYDFYLKNILTNDDLKIEIKTIDDGKDININAYSFNQTQNLIDCYIITRFKQSTVFVNELNQNIDIKTADIILLNKSFFSQNCKNIEANKEKKITEHKRLEYKFYSKFL